MDDDLTGHQFPIIALACSAGGLDAVTRILAALPQQLPAAIIVLQHLEPTGPDMLAGILGRRTALPVRTAADGDRLAAGRVWVAPRGHHTLVTAELSIALVESGAIPPHRPSADLLLTTLALAAGPWAVAVVLTGGGIDAATGATVIHRFGGTVLVASPETSAVASMPQAAINRDSITDQVVALDDLAGLLCALAAADPLTPPH